MIRKNQLFPLNDHFCARAGLAIGVLWLGWQIYKSITLMSPIMASDEYAYWIQSRYIGQKDVLDLDPLLQRLDNRLFFSFQHLFLKFPNGSILARFVHIGEWLSSAALLFFAFKEIMSFQDRLISVFICLLLPYSFYALTVLPELELVFLGSILSFLTIRKLRNFPRSTALQLGVACGLGLMIKPHAIAWLPACSVMLFFFGFTSFPRGSKLSTSIKLAVYFWSAWYVTFIFIWKLTGSEWNFDPTIAMGMKFYGDYVKLDRDVQKLSSVLLSTAMYASLHLIVLCTLFLPTAIGLALKFKRCLIGIDKLESTDTLASFFLAALLFSHLAMVSYFSATAAARDVGEALRLHGRYFGVVLVTLPFLSLLMLSAFTRSNAKLIGVLGIGTVVVLQFTVINFIKIYPWDYPELFGFFRTANHYQWSFSNENFTSWLSYIVILAASIVMLTIPRALKFAFIAQIFGLMLIAQIKIHRWVDVHLEGNKSSIIAANTFGHLIGVTSPEKLVVIGAERYGKLSYILFALGKAASVKQISLPNRIDKEHVAGIHWAILADDYEVAFPYFQKVSLGGLTLYRLVDQPLK